MSGDPAGHVHPAAPAMSRSWPVLARRHGWLLCCLALIAFTAALIWIAKGGYTAEDDYQYLVAANGWRQNGIFVGTNHWHMRLPHILSITVSFLLFGFNETAMQLPTILAMGVIVLLTAALVKRAVDPQTGLFAGLLVAATPVFIFYAKIPYPDINELLYALLSFALMWKGLADARYRWFIASGAAMAVAWLIRSSCIPFILLYGILFLIGYRVPRTRYLAMGLGFAPLILAEWAFYRLHTGNAFYRYAIDIDSLEIPTAHMVGGVANGLRPPFNSELMAKWVPNSIIDVHWAINPYIDFLTNPSFGVLYASALIAGIYLWRDRGLPQRQREFIRIIGLLIALSIFTTIYVLNLRPQPRYFMPASWGACIVVALAFRRGPWRWHKKWATAILAIFLLGDIALITARNDSMQAERQLLSYVQDQRTPVTTDLVKARFLLEQNGVAHLVRFIRPSDRPPAAPLLTSSDMQAHWLQQHAGTAIAAPRQPSLPDRLWAAIVPAPILAKLRPRRELVRIEWTTPTRR